MESFEVAVKKNEKQIRLERQGCVLQGQELMDNHELDPKKECYCGRPNKFDLINREERGWKEIVGFVVNMMKNVLI